MAFTGTPLKTVRILSNYSGTGQSSTSGKNCFVCGRNVDILGRNWSSIFESGITAKPKNFHIRLAKILDIPPLHKENVGSHYCICRGCISKLEKIERGQQLLSEFTKQYASRFQRVKRGSKDSPGIKVVKQRLTRTPTEQQLGTRTVVKRSSIQSEGDPFHVDPVPIPTAQCTDGEQSHNSITRVSNKSHHYQHSISLLQHLKD